MCVIIFIPQGEQISKDELKDAWNTNPDGAGYSIRTADGVQYARGFMNFKDFFNAIRHHIGGVDLLLHFRISTSKAVNQLQTHPYEIGRKTALKGVSDIGVACMNGTITGQTEYKGYNDTMSYLQDHTEGFQLIAETASQDLLNIVQSDTGARWAVMTPDAVILSSDFIEEEGKFYSNLNHLYKTYTTYYSYGRGLYRTKNPRDYLQKKLFKQVVKDKALYNDVLDFLYCCTYAEADALRYYTDKESLKTYLMFTGYY